MAINPENYGSRGGNLALVLCCPNVVADDHLVYLDYNRKSRNWVIRDFIAQKRLDSQHSRLTVEEVEADATHNEPPAWCNVEEQPEDWRRYLSLRTTAVRQLSGPLGLIKSPNPLSGEWQPLRF